MALKGSDFNSAQRRKWLAAELERMRFEEYLQYASNKWRVIFSHILYGMLRGMGFALGFSILSALVVVVLRHIVVENIPLIGGFLAEVINAIQQRL